MAFQALTNSFIYLPTPIICGQAAPTVSTTQGRIDAAAEKFAVICQVPKTGTLDKFECRFANVTFGGSSVLRYSFQDVSLTTGDPDGTQDQFRDATGVANGWQVPGLITSDGTDGGVKRSVTEGDLLACVIEYQTFTAADTIDVINQITASQAEFDNLPYGDLFTASWAKQVTLNPVLTLKYNDGTYVSPNRCIPASSFSTISTFNTGAANDERGNLFQVPYPVRIIGMWARLAVGATADFEMILYNAASTALRTISVDANVVAATSGRTFFRRFSSKLELTPNVNYRAVIKPTTANNLSIYEFAFNSAAILSGYFGGGLWQATRRADAGAWTDVTTDLALVGLVCDAFDDAVSVGGARIIGA